MTALVIHAPTQFEVCPLYAVTFMGPDRTHVEVSTPQYPRGTKPVAVYESLNPREAIFAFGIYAQNQGITEELQNTEGKIIATLICTGTP